MVRSFRARDEELAGAGALGPGVERLLAHTHLATDLDDLRPRLLLAQRLRDLFLGVSLPLHAPPCG